MPEQQQQQVSFIVPSDNISDSQEGDELVGGVYTMSNDVEENTMIVYARRKNGTLKLLQPALKTGGQGAVLNLGMGFDPLFSAFSVVITTLVVNAGSNSVSVFEILPDFFLYLAHVQPVVGFGPNSMVVSGNLVYVAVTDAEGTFDDVFSKNGVLSGFYLTSTGTLTPITCSRRLLNFRPSAIKFSPDRRSLVVSDLFSGVNARAHGTINEIVAFTVNRGGLLSPFPVSGVISTALNNPEGRKLPSAVGFEIIRSQSTQYIVVPEVRCLAGADGMSPAEQAASVSAWRLDSKGRLFPVQLDAPVGSSVTSGQFESCWIEFSANFGNFWATNTPSNSFSAFSFRNGVSTLEEEVAVSGTSPVDLWQSGNGKFLYVLLAGSVGAFEISKGGEGAGLVEIQNATGVPELNAQGIVAF